LRVTSTRHDPVVDRRRFLQVGAGVGLGAAALGGALVALGTDDDHEPGGDAGATSGAGQPSVAEVLARPYEPVAAFPSGVLSGDPTGDAVLLWTRIDPAEADDDGGADVDWVLARDPGLRDVVTRARARTDADHDHTVAVEVTGLEPSTTYWYGFTVGATASPLGRTRTLPVGATDGVRFGVFSCQRYAHGWYNAHADLAARAGDEATDLDFVVCLGDYVYEAGPADDVTVEGRVDPEAPTVTLADFRRQYHLFRSDPDLQAMHARFPIFAIFDNHDGFGQPSDPAGPGARAAFFEQLPVRRQTDPIRQHRSFPIGDLADLYLLDERQYRDPTASKGDNPLGPSTVEEPLLVATDRTMLGDAQRTWLLDGVASSTAHWKILGSQLTFAPLRSALLPDVTATAGDGPQRNAGRYLNVVGWDGYQAERRQILDRLHEDEVDGVLVVSGDSHFWTASALSTDYDDPDAPPVLSEFGPSSITSANAGEMRTLPPTSAVREIARQTNPNSLLAIEVETHGYGVVELTPTLATVDFVEVPTATHGARGRLLARYEVAQDHPVPRRTGGEDLIGA
jgi:alkaline phosphatase D